MGWALIAQTQLYTSPGSFATHSAVTRTEFGHLNIGEPDADSGRGGGSPRPEGFLAEEAERAAECQMALDVESVLDGGVNG